MEFNRVAFILQFVQRLLTAVIHERGRGIRSQAFIALDT